MTPQQGSPIENNAFRDWLAVALSVTGLGIVEARAPTGGGWSSETWLLTIRDGARVSAADRRVVMRLAPSGPAMFPDYDLGRQVACMRALRTVQGCPVPDILADDLAGVVIGRPFYVMEFIPGDVPADDRPTLFEAGFLFEASAADQRRFHETFLAAMAALHTAPSAADITQSLARPNAGSTALARELAWLRGIFDWGHGPVAQPVIARALDRLDRRLPDDAREVMLWGDARPANVVVRDFAPAALLDWELATLGPPEMDVFWLLEMNHMRSKGRLLPGFLDDAGSIARYQDLTGFSIRDADWHILFAATKVSLLMLRHLLVRVACGDMPGDHAILTDNISTRRLSSLLERAAG